MSGNCNRGLFSFDHPAHNTDISKCNKMQIISKSTKVLPVSNMFMSSLSVVFQAAMASRFRARPISFPRLPSEANQSQYQDAFLAHRGK